MSRTCAGLVNGNTRLQLGVSNVIRKKECEVFNDIYIFVVISVVVCYCSRHCQYRDLLTVYHSGYQGLIRYLNELATYHKYRNHRHSNTFSVVRFLGIC